MAIRCLPNVLLRNQSVGRSVGQLVSQAVNGAWSNSSKASRYLTLVLCSSLPLHTPPHPFSIDQA